MYYYQKLIVFTLQLVLEVLSGTSSNSMNKIYLRKICFIKFLFRYLSCKSHIMIRAGTLNALNCYKLYMLIFLFWFCTWTYFDEFRFSEHQNRFCLQYSHVCSNIYKKYVLYFFVLFLFLLFSFSFYEFQWETTNVTSFNV